MSNLIKTLFLLLLVNALFSCQGSNTEQVKEENNKTSQKEEISEKLPQAVAKRNGLKITKILTGGSWYEGKIDKYPIWMFISDKDKDGSLTAFYGYTSTKGVGIPLYPQ